MHEPARPRPGPVHFLCLTALALVVFLQPLWEAEFLNFDDPFFFGPVDPWTDGDADAGLWTRLVHAWTGTYADAYLPIFHTSLLFDRVVFGVQPLGPHLHSLLLHLLAAFLVAHLVFELGVSAARAALVAGAFLVHPALVESVAWVSGRKDLLSGIFALVAWIAVARHAAGGSTRTLAPVALLATVLALYSKATAVVIPLVAVVVGSLAARAAWRRRVEDRAARAASPRSVTAPDASSPWLPGSASEPLETASVPVPAVERGGLQRLGLLAALFVVTALIGFQHTWIARAAGTLAPVDIAPLDRLEQVPGAFFHYLRVTVWPTSLDVLYPEVKTLEAFRTSWPWTLPVLVACALGAVLASRIRRTRRLAFGFAMWALALLPFNTFWPASSIAAADRYLYLAIPGAALALLTIRGRLMPVISLFVVAALAFAAADRARDFQSSATLWRASYERDDENAVAHLNYVEAIQSSAAPVTDAAIEKHLRRAAEVARYPQHALRADGALARFYVARGRNEDALLAAGDAVDVALELDGRQAGAAAAKIETILMAATLATLVGDADLAERRIAQAREIAPQHPVVLAYDAELLLGRALAEAESAGRGDGRVPADDPRRARGERLVAEALAVPGGENYYEVQLAAGRWAAATGRRLEAIRHFDRAIEIQPGLTQAYVAKTNLFVAQGLQESAETTVRQGLAATGTRDPQLVYYLAIVLKARGREDEAIDYFEAFLRLRPGDPAARKALAELLAARAMRGVATLDAETLKELGRRIRELEPLNPKGRFVQGVAARQEADFDTALVLLEQAASELPGRDDVRRVFYETVRDAGWMELRRGARERAFSLLQRFVEEAPAELPKEAAHTALRSEANRLRGVGEEALQGGRPEDALRAFERARELTPADGSLAMLVGLARFAVVPAGAGDDASLEILKAADEAFAEAAEWAAGERRDPALPLYYRARTLDRLGRRDDALVLVRDYLATDPAGDEDLLARLRALADQLERR
jgi:tetratricopeptide (TPR) repeat protein